MLDGALQSGDGMISYQVVQEFLNVATRKFQVPLKPESAEIYLRKILHPFCRIFPDLELYQTALDVLKATGYSFYDSLIIAGAIRGGCAILYTEDLQAGQQVKSVKIINPFA